MSTDTLEQLPTSGDAIRLRIVSQIAQKDAPLPYEEAFGGSDGEAAEFDDAFPEDIEDAALRYLDSRSEEHGEELTRIEQNTEAALSVQNGRVTISYDDSELSEGLPTLTQITFTLDEPKLVAIVRSGGTSSMYILEEGRRHVCELSAGGMTLPVTFSTGRVRNTVSDGAGVILLEYTVEISGAVSQHTIMKIEVLPDPDGGTREFG